MPNFVVQLTTTGNRPLGLWGPIPTQDLAFALCDELTTEYPLCAYRVYALREPREPFRVKTFEPGRFKTDELLKEASVHKPVSPPWHECICDHKVLCLCNPHHTCEIEEEVSKRVRASMTASEKREAVLLEMNERLLTDLKTTLSKLYGSQGVDVPPGDQVPFTGHGKG